MQPRSPFAIFAARLWAFLNYRTRLGVTWLELLAAMFAGMILVWDALRDEGTLTGSPAQWRQGPNRLYGDSVIFSPSKGSIKVISKRRVEATVVSGELPSGLPLQ